MPKENIDYSNTIIYKIYCNDDTITDIYVGHTTHFIQRKYQHKVLSNESKNVLKIYKTIRENGGWDNWSMVEIATYNCKNSTEARIKEQIHYEELHASLNSCAPYIDKTKYFCVECDVQCSSPKLFNSHINCISHNKMKKNKANSENEIVQIGTGKKNLKKNLNRFLCETCDFKCYMKCDWERHIIRPKHLKGVNEGAKGKTKNENNLKKTYFCKNCDKHFVTQSGLWKHNLKCEYHNTLEDANALENIKNNEINQQQLIDYLMKENSEFKQLMLEQNKHMLELIKNAGNNNT